MNVLTVWNKNSTNFNANVFVRANGTDRQEIESEDVALHLMNVMIHSNEIDRAVLETRKGHLTWETYQPDKSEVCGCQDAGDGWCDCDRCSPDCDEDEDFDINDPRR